jgi:hypothetical protein
VGRPGDFLRPKKIVRKRTNTALLPTMTLAADDFDFHLMAKTVEEQYDVTLEFCNAQTELLNIQNPSAQGAGSSEGRPPHRILQDYDTRVRRVQEHRVQLESIKDSLQHGLPQYRLVFAVYQAHVERTRRVLQTVQQAGGGVWSSHGLSLAVNDSDTVTVALTTLRASVQTVRDALAPHLAK